MGTGTNGTSRFVVVIGSGVGGSGSSTVVGGAVVVATDGDGRARRVTAPRPSAA